MMDITIRDSEPEDAQAIFDLRSDSRLARMQYSPSAFEIPTTLLELTQRGPQIPRNGWMCSTILVDDQFAGHITQVYRTLNHGAHIATLGWNVIPELWGNGVAPAAVKQLIIGRFKKTDQLVFLAYCFESNKRCVRVLEKLGFQERRPFWQERFGNYLRTMGKHKLLKFTVSSNEWSA